MELKGRCVHFAIKDIYLPPAAEVLAALHGDDVIAGVVVDSTDAGAEPDAFVVVQVAQVPAPVVVPVGRLREGS